MSCISLNFGRTSDITVGDPKQYMDESDDWSFYLFGYKLYTSIVKRNIGFFIDQYLFRKLHILFRVKWIVIKSRRMLTCQKIVINKG